MNILQINETCGTGSIGRTTSELAFALRERGIGSYVAYSTGQSTFPDSYHIGTAIDKKVHAVLSRIFGLQGYYSIVSTYKLLHYMDKVKPDVVHLRNLHGNYINLKVLFRYLLKKDIAVIITLHDCWFYTGKCTYYVPANCKKWQKNCGNCPLLFIDNVNPTLFFDRTSKCLEDKKRYLCSIRRLSVVGVSKWVAKEAEKSFLSDRNPISIYNWIDQSAFFPRDITRKKDQMHLDDKFVILMVTTGISPAKGLNVLLELTKLMDDTFQIIVVGKNKDNYVLPSNILHINHTNDANELAEYYSLADVCVNTTKFETFGKVTAEALCCGTPVIVYNNTASPELVGERCGYVVNEEDGIIVIKKAIETIKKNGKAYYSSYCVQFSLSNFDIKQGVSSYVNLYEKLMSC